MATAFPASKSVVLSSWKEIAAYLGRGVRTVQRYERDLALPVHRPRGNRRAVLALADEIDVWLRSAPKSEFERGSKPRELGNGTNLQATALLTTVRQTIGQGAELRDRCNSLRAAHHEVVTTLLSNLTGLVDGVNKRSRVGLAKRRGTRGLSAEHPQRGNGSR